MLPSLRKQLKSGASNRSLKDILSPTAKAIEVLSVEELEYQVHNTRTVVVVEEGGIQEERVLIYNRLDLNQLLSGVVLNGTTLEQKIEELNAQGFDFTEDDLELVDNKIKAKATSLGYYNKVAITTGVDHVYATSNLSILDHVIVNGEVVDLNTGNDSTNIAALRAKGISVYESYESYGCWSLGRYQNMTNQVLDVIVVVDDANFGFGLSYLQPQDNQTITGMNNEGLNEGYRQLNFTLHPDATHLPIEPTQIPSWSWNGLAIKQKNTAGEDYLYRFTVDDEVITNASNKQLFNISELGEINSLLVVKGVFISTTTPDWYHIGTLNPGDVRKVRISQLGNNDLSTRLTQLGFPFCVEATPTIISLEGYLYDPINLGD